MNKISKIKLMAVVLVAVSALFAVSCQQEGGPNNPGEGYNAIFSSAVSDGNVFSTLQTASIESEASFDMERGMPEFNGNGRENKRPPEKGMFLGRVMRELKLTEEQRDMFFGFMQEHRICMEEACLLSREAREKIMTEANAERALILADLKNGVIDRETAKALLMELNQSTREQLEADPNIELTKEAQCVCLRELFAKIESMLTEEQLVIWQRFLENFKHPCLEEEPI